MRRILVFLLLGLVGCTQQQPISVTTPNQGIASLTQPDVLERAREVLRNYLGDDDQPSISPGDDDMPGKTAPPGTACGFVGPTWCREVYRNGRTYVTKCSNPCEEFFLVGIDAGDGITQEICLGPGGVPCDDRPSF